MEEDVGSHDDEEKKDANGGVAMVKTTTPWSRKTR